MRFLRPAVRLPAALAVVMIFWSGLAAASGYYDLYTAMTRNNLGAVRSMAPRGAALNRIDRATGATPLTWACMKDVNPEIVEFLLSAGADPEMIDGEGNTPLTTAAMYGNIEAARVLLSRGADPCAPDARGLAPIAVASGRKGRVEVVKILMESGIRPDSPQVRQALDRAMSFNNREIVEYLAKAGARPGYFAALKMILPQ